MLLLCSGCFWMGLFISGASLAGLSGEGTPKAIGLLSALKPVCLWGVLMELRALR